MAISVILGSSNSQGNTRALVDSLFAESEISLIDLNQYSFTDWDYEAQNLEDQFQLIVPKLIASTDIIFATPVYWYSMSAQMKRFFDRLSDLITRRKELGRSLAGRRTWLLVTGTEPILPEGFVTPFERTSNYFDMTFCDSFYAQMTDDEFTADFTAETKSFRTQLFEQVAPEKQATRSES